MQAPQHGELARAERPAVVRVEVPGAGEEIVGLAVYQDRDERPAVPLALQDHPGDVIGVLGLGGHQHDDGDRVGELLPDLPEVLVTRKQVADRPDGQPGLAEMSG